MQTTKPTAKTPEAAEPPVLQKRIGSTTYVVNVRFCSSTPSTPGGLAKETLEQKTLRLIESEVRKLA